jgi:hypothetical protein
MAAPYEAAIVAIVNLISEAIKGQPAEVRAELWKMHVEDIKAWREFWKGFGDMFKQEGK